MPKNTNMENIKKMEKVICKCECGKKLERYDERHRERKYINHHGATGKKNGRNVGEIRIDERGYCFIYLPNHPQSYRRRYALHRYIMEQHLGRILTREEVVHHIDKNKSNNDISNLQLMANDKEHQALHLKQEHRKPFLGWHHSEESKQKMREKLTNRYFSPETRKKISLSKMGKKMKSPSEETKIKMREAQLNRWKQYRIEKGDLK
jgi:hypothetical protein